MKHFNKIIATVIITLFSTFLLQAQNLVMQHPSAANTHQIGSVPNSYFTVYNAPSTNGIATFKKTNLETGEVIMLGSTTQTAYVRDKYNGTYNVSYSLTDPTPTVGRWSYSATYQSGSISLQDDVSPVYIIDNVAIELTSSTLNSGLINLKADLSGAGITGNETVVFTYKFGGSYNPTRLAGVVTEPPYELAIDLPQGTYDVWAGILDTYIGSTVQEYSFGVFYSSIETDKIRLRVIDNNARFGDDVIANEASLTNMQVYPNPFMNEIKLSGFGTEPIRLVTFNSLGQEVLNLQLTNPENYSFGSSLESGMYFLKVYKNGKFISQQKIIKQ